MDYLYGTIKNVISDSNVTVISPDGTIIPTQQGNQISLDVNTQKIVQLKKLNKNGVISYQLFAYNGVTQSFDIPMGDEIFPVSVGNTEGGSGVNITSALINGQPVPASVNENGQLVIDHIPISAIEDSEFYQDGNLIRKYESIIDGNA